MMNGQCWGMGWGMWLIPLAIILIIVFAVKYNPFGVRQNSESSLEILKKRYAKGEITKEQFEEMKNNI